MTKLTLYYATNRKHEGKDRWHPESYGTKFSDDGMENLRFGAVSVEAVRAMALGALTRSHAQVALAITGIAGPDGGMPDKPVGTVWFAVASQAEGRVERQVFAGDRDAVRRQAVAHALRILIETCAAV